MPRYIHRHRENRWATFDRPAFQVDHSQNFSVARSEFAVYEGPDLVVVNPSASDAEVVLGESF